LQPSNASVYRLALAVVLAVTSIPAFAAKYQALYSFGGGTDGTYPAGRLVFDADGNLYGVTSYGGGTSCSGNYRGCGIVFKLTAAPSGKWKETVLHRFHDPTHPDDGNEPNGGLVFDSSRNLYGATASGGIGNSECSYFAQFTGCGIVFELSPQPKGEWDETVLYQFQDQGDGGNPQPGLILDQEGNLYGTASAGGQKQFGYYYGSGVAFRLMQADNWTEDIVHTFCGDAQCADGASPYAGLISDAAGNLYGTTMEGGVLDFPCGTYGCGTVYMLTPNGDGTYTHNVLHKFLGRDGKAPTRSLTSDPQGNLYGTTLRDGAFGFGTVFKLTPQPDGKWKHYAIYNFRSGIRGWQGSFSTRVVFDALGNLYGTNLGGVGGACGGSSCGVVYKLSPGGKYGRWKYKVIHSFDGYHGGLPAGDLIVDSQGNLYGTAQIGGYGGFGVVFKITP
jgi:uncharacterized repeat protein (TIGR03803 family)